MDAQKALLYRSLILLEYICLNDFNLIFILDFPQNT